MTPFIPSDSKRILNTSVLFLLFLKSHWAVFCYKNKTFFQEIDPIRSLHSIWDSWTRGVSMEIFAHSQNPCPADTCGGFRYSPNSWKIFNLGILRMVREGGIRKLKQDKYAGLRKNFVKKKWTLSKAYITFPFMKYSILIRGKIGWNKDYSYIRNQG